MVYGRTPWSGITLVELKNAVLEKPLRFYDGIDISDDLKQLIIKMLALEEKDRISITDLHNHSYFRYLRKS